MRSWYKCWVVTSHLKGIVETVRCVLVNWAQHFREDWKKDELEYKTDLENRSIPNNTIKILEHSLDVDICSMNFVNADSI